MVEAATRKRGGKSGVPNRPEESYKAASETSLRAERALEQGLEESMAGSDPPSITQPGKIFHTVSSGSYPGGERPVEGQRQRVTAQRYLRCLSRPCITWQRAKAAPAVRPGHAPGHWLACEPSRYV